MKDDSEPKHDELDLFYSEKHPRNISKTCKKFSPFQTLMKTNFSLQNISLLRKGQTEED